MSACETLFAPAPPVKPEIVVETECSWAKPLTISEKTFGFIAENIADPEVRRDADQIVAYNEAHGKFCGS